MEVPKVLRLCDELNKMGMKYLIFTIDNKSLKSYGDDLSAKTLEDKADLVENLEQILANSKMLEDAKAGQDPKPGMDGEVFFHGAGRGEARKKIYGTGNPPFPTMRGGAGKRSKSVGRG